MHTIRSLTGAMTAQRVIVTFAMAFAVIVGLLAMHAISAPGHAAVEPASISEAGALSAEHHPAEHCAGNCGLPAQFPDHSMLLMACVLALLVTTIVLAAPAFLARLGVALALSEPVLRAVRALPRLRPPSLTVLSISRT